MTTPVWLPPAYNSVLRQAASAAGLDGDAAVAAYITVHDSKSKYPYICVAVDFLAIAAFVAHILKGESWCSPWGLALLFVSGVTTVLAARFYSALNRAMATLKRIPFTKKLVAMLGLDYIGIVGVEAAVDGASPARPRAVSTFRAQMEKTTAQKTPNIDTISVKPASTLKASSMYSPALVRAASGTVRGPWFGSSQLLDRSLPSDSLDALIGEIAESKWEKEASTRDGGEGRWVSGELTKRRMEEELAQWQPEVGDEPSRPYALARRSAAAEIKGQILRQTDIKRLYRLEVTQVEQSGRAVAAAFSAHFKDVFRPLYERNAGELEAASKGHLSKFFLLHRQRTAAMPGSRANVLLGDLVSEMRFRHDSRYFVKRPCTKAQALEKQRPFKALQRVIRTTERSSSLKLGNSNVNVRFPSQLADTESVDLWVEKAVLEEFLNVPGMPSVDASGAAMDPAKYVYDRLAELARPGDLSTCNGDGWGVEPDQAVANGLPTDAQILIHYLCMMLDSEVARADTGASPVSPLSKPFSRHHVIYGKIMKEKPLGLPPGLENPALSSLLGIADDKDTKSRQFKLHIPTQIPEFTIHILHGEAVMDLGNNLGAAICLPKTVGAYCCLLLERAQGSIDAVPMQDALSALCRVPRFDKDAPRSGIYSLIR